MGEGRRKGRERRGEGRGGGRRREEEGLGMESLFTLSKGRKEMQTQP